MKTILKSGLLIIAVLINACASVEEVPLLGSSRFVINSAYKLDSEEKGVETKVEGSDKIVSTDYSASILQSPTFEAPTVGVQLKATNKYSYDTELQAITKYRRSGFSKFTLALGGAGVVGGFAANYSDRSGGFLLIGTGLILFTANALLPNGYSVANTLEGSQKFYEKVEIPEYRTPVAVKGAESQKLLYTDNEGNIQWSLTNDFKLVKLNNSQDFTFSLTTGDKAITVKDYNGLTFNSSDWTKEFVKVRSNGATIKDQRGYILKTPLIGLTYASLGLVDHKNAYHIDFGNNKTGYIEKDFVESYWVSVGNTQELTSIAGAIKEYVEVKIEKWQEKGEFENSAAYAYRMQNREQKVRDYTEEAIAHYQEDYKKSISWERAQIVGKYDSESQTFKVNIPELGDLIVPVPIVNQQAENFKANWSLVELHKPTFGLVDGNWELFHLSFFNPVDSTRTHYDHRLQADYDPTRQFDFKFTDINISINNPDNNSFLSDESSKNFDPYDVEFNLPATAMDNPNAIAVVIGNAEYKHAKNVNYATNDAESIKKYLINVAGYEPNNVFLLKNITKGEFEAYFGTNTNYKGMLFNSVIPNESDVFIFYSGHGAPDLSPGNEGAGYFVPIECHPNNVNLMGFSLSQFYENLDKVPARSKTVVLDACFSGADLLEGISPMVIPDREANVTKAGMVVLTSSSGTQVSSWYHQKRHGMFTYFFLKAIHDKENSDKNGDNKLTFQEIYDYATDKKGVKYYSKRINSVTQEPTISGKKADKDRVFIEYADTQQD